MPLRNQFTSEAEWLEHLRLYFAAKAMQGYFAAPHTPHRGAATPAAAAYCYEMADAMLAARNTEES